MHLKVKKKKKKWLGTRTEISFIFNFLYNCQTASIKVTLKVTLVSKSFDTFQMLNYFKSKMYSFINEKTDKCRESFMIHRLAGEFLQCHFVQLTRHIDLIRKRMESVLYCAAENKITC